MNLCENGVAKVVGPVTRIITEDELCFAVDVLDYYDKRVTIKKMTLAEMRSVLSGEYTWLE